MGTVSEGNQSERLHNSNYVTFKKGKTIQAAKRSVVARGRKKGESAKHSGLLGW